MKTGATVGLLVVAMALVAGNAFASKRSEAKAAQKAAEAAAAAERQAAYERSIPVCKGEADCTAKWDAAQLAVVSLAGYRIQTATSVFIQTYGPIENDTNLAMRVTKQPTQCPPSGDTEAQPDTVAPPEKCYRIVVETFCALAWSTTCWKRLYPARDQFNAMVNAQ